MLAQGLDDLLAADPLQENRKASEIFSISPPKEHHFPKRNLFFLQGNKRSQKLVLTEVGAWLVALK
jgi:hypothetical protein